jgi:hypothetical protein
MPFLSFLARTFLLRRLFGGGGGRRRGGYGYGYGRRPQRGRFGLFGPFPTYSTRTRGGTRVSVGGCCLPIPLALSALVVAAIRLLTTRR